MIQKNISFLAIILASAGTLVLFQNCTPNAQREPASEVLAASPDELPIDQANIPPIGNGGGASSKTDAQVRDEFLRTFPASWADMVRTQQGMDSFSTLKQKAVAPWLPPSGPLRLGLPKLLSIGDSISLCYLPYLQRNLRDRYTVVHVPHNGASTENGKNWLDEYLEFGPFETIVVNWGLHDSSGFRKVNEVARYKHKTDLLTYEARLREMLPRLKKTGSRVVWIYSTPTLNPESKPVNGSIKGTYNEDVMARNEIARKVIADLKIEGIDPVDPSLNSVPLSFHDDKLHFQPESCESFGLAISRGLARVPELPRNRGFWDLSPWSSCEAGSRNRNVRCVDVADKPIAVNVCDASSKPSARETCTPPKFSWRARAWSDCRNGSQVRPVKCMDHRNTIREPTNCDPAKKPEESQSCT